MGGRTNEDKRREGRDEQKVQPVEVIKQEQEGVLQGRGPLCRGRGETPDNGATEEEERREPEQSRGVISV